VNTKEFAQLLINKRIATVQLAQQPNGEVGVEKIHLHDGTVVEFRGENGYSSNAVATIRPPRKMP
jgi:hypothetical protein